MAKTDKKAAPAGNGLANKLRNASDTNLLLSITVIVFFLMYIGAIVFQGSGFLKPQTFFNILNNNAALIILACGLSLVMITGGIDISVGGITALISMCCAVYLDYKGGNVFVSVLIALAIGLAFGLFQGFLVAYLDIQPFIVTLAGMFFARGMTAVICTDQVSIVSDALFVKLSNMKLNIPFNIGAYENKKGILQVPYVRITVVIALLVVLLIFLMLKYTKFGRSIYAVGGNSQSATLMGLDVRKTKMKTYILASFLASIGGICYCLNTMCGTTTQASGLEMDAISSAVIGGTLLTGGVGNVGGSLVGVMINGTISTLVKSHGKLVSSWANIVTAILLCFFIVLQAILAKIKESKKA